MTQIFTIDLYEPFAIIQSMARQKKEKLGPVPEEIIKIALTNQSIRDPGVVEYLVSNGRIPNFAEVYSGDDPVPTVMVTVPPPGVKLGDTRKFFSIGTEKFLSPDGKSKGWAKNYDLKIEEARELQKRTRMAVRELRKLTDKRPFWKRWLRVG